MATLGPIRRSLGAVIPFVQTFISLLSLSFVAPSAARVAAHRCSSATITPWPCSISTEHRANASRPCWAFAKAAARCAWPRTPQPRAEFITLFREVPTQPKAEHQEDLAKQLAEVKAAYAKLTEQGWTKDDSDFYTVVVFERYNERAEF